MERFRMRTAALFSLVWMIGCGSSLPRPEFERFDVRVTPTAAEHPDVPAVVLLNRGTLNMTVDAKNALPIGRLRHLHRVKVLRETGLGRGKVVVPFTAGEAIYGLTARSISPEGEIWYADPDDERLIKLADGRQAKSLTVPKVAPGWVVEHTYDRYIRDVRFVEPWVFQTDVPTLRSEFAVVAPTGFAVDVRYSRDGAFVDETPERFDTPEGTRFFWSASDQPAIFDEPGMPSRALMAPRAHVVFQSARLRNDTFVGFGSWDDVGAWFFDRVPAWSEVGDATVQEAKRVAGDTSEEEKALKIQAAIASGLGWSSKVHVPVYRADLPLPEEVLREKAGNRTSRGLLLTALLRAAGLPAVPALVAHRGEDVIIPDAPTAVNLTGVVAVIDRPNGSLILDPNQLTVTADVPSPALQGTRMVVLRGDVAEVRKVPISAPEASKSELRYTLELDTRGSIFGRLEGRLTGAEAGELRTALVEAAPVDYASVVNAFLAARGAGLGVDSVRIADREALRRPLTIEGTIAPTQVVEGEATEAFVRVGRFIGGPDTPMREVRRAPLMLGVPRTVDLFVRLTLPEDHETGALAPPVSEAWSGGQVDLSMRAETRRRFGFSRIETRTALDVPTKRYPEYRRFREGVRVAEDQVFSIKRPPPKILEY